MADTDVAAAVNRVLRRAEMRFDNAIALLIPEEEKLARLAQLQTQNTPGYAWGRMVAAFNEALANFASAFNAGKADYERRIR